MTAFRTRLLIDALPVLRAIVTIPFYYLSTTDSYARVVDGPCEYCKYSAEKSFTVGVAHFCYDYGYGYSGQCT